MENTVDIAFYCNEKKKRFLEIIKKRIMHKFIVIELFWINFGVMKRLTSKFESKTNLESL